MGNIPTTGGAVNGRTQAITIGSQTVNCYDTVPLAPAMNEPSVEIQRFQGGDATSITADGGYQTTTLTCEYTAAIWSAFNTARANATPQPVTLPDFTGSAIVTVSEGPTLTVAGTAVPTMTVSLNWTSTAAVTGSEQ